MVNWKTSLGNNMHESLGFSFIILLLLLLLLLLLFDDPLLLIVWNLDFYTITV